MYHWVPIYQLTPKNGQFDIAWGPPRVAGAGAVHTMKLMRKRLFMLFTLLLLVGLSSRFIREAIGCKGCWSYLLPFSWSCTARSNA